MKHRLFFLFLVGIALTGYELSAQVDSLISTSQDAIYDRPFIKLGKTRTAVGGYLEANTNYFVEDGVGEGFTMEMRRFNIFLYAQVHPRIKFLSELEFEHGTEEIALETALLDIEFNPALNFRAGILLPAIGLVNTNHDSPNWEFVERPLSSTALIPSTLSEVGFGLHGKFFPSTQSILSYDIYIVNGLQEHLILNEEGRTHLPSGKSEEMFGEDNNGLPMFNAKLGYSHRKLGEIGLSIYGGVYNRFRLDGSPVEDKRYVFLTAFDFQTQVSQLTIQGEFAYASIDVPTDIQEIYGTTQYAGFIDLVYPIIKTKIWRFEQAIVNIAVRLEMMDYNVGQFSTNINQNIGDENRGFALGLGFRPSSGTILRLNYRYHWIRDSLGNPPARAAGFQFGIASYF